MQQYFEGILSAQEREDRAMVASEEAVLCAVRHEFVNGGQLIAKARERGFSAAAFFAGSGLPVDMPLPVRRSDGFYVKKHTAVQRPYLHGHAFYELLYVQSGSCLQMLPGGKRVVLRTGECCLLRPGAAHCIERVRESDVILKAVIPSPLFERVSWGIPLPQSPFAVFSPMPLSARYLFGRLLRESVCRDVCREAAAEALLTLLFCELSRAEAQGDPSAELLYGEWFRGALKGASLAQFAKKYGYTPAYASRLLKQRTGRTFTQLLTGYRLQRAAELLSSSDMSVEDIAAEVGYQVASALYKQFGAHFGMTPAEYRRALQKE